MQEQRRYKSPLREQQASETRGRILDAAKKLLVGTGYAKTTIDAIAKEAVVSPQTVYAAFKNKRNIFSALIHQSIESEVDALYRETIHVEGVHERIRRIAAIIIKCNVKLNAENTILRSAGILSPELAKIQRNCEEKGRRIQREYNKALLDGVALRQGLSIDKALDIFWYLTKPDAYTALVIECGWSHEAFATWLYESLAALIAE